jgi:hypothetical protein
LHGSVRFATELSNSLNGLGHSPAIGWVVVAQTTAIGVEGKCSMGCLKIAVTDESPAAAAFTKT